MNQFTDNQVLAALVGWLASLIVFGFFVDHFAEQEGFKKGWAAREQHAKDKKETKKFWKKFNRKGD